RADLLVDASEGVEVLLGNGDGTFQDFGNVPTAYYPGALAAADVNRDGRADLIVANFYDADVSVLLGNGDGSFQEQRRFAAVAGPFALATQDVDGDGRLDILVAGGG